MWQNEYESKYSNYLNSKHLIVSGKATRMVSGGTSEIPTPNYGATAPVMHHPHPCQMSKSRLPLKMVVSDVVHRDFGPLQQPSPSPSRFIVTPKKRSSPYDYYKTVVHSRSRTLRNHPIVDEIQKKFNSIYGCHFQNATSDTPCTSTSLAHESPMETDGTDQESNKQESCIPKFSTFYKEFLQKQQSVSEDKKISVYNSTNKYTLIEENEIENDESKEENTNKEQEHFMLAKNFLHTVEEKQPGNEEDDSASKYSKHKSEDEYSSTSSQEYCSQNDNFCFSPLLAQKKEGFIPSRSIPKTWTPKHKTPTADSKCSAVDKIDVLGHNSASNTSEEESSIWFADDDDEDLN